jgi:hypothetical protein
MTNMRISLLAGLVAFVSFACDGVIGPTSDAGSAGFGGGSAVATGGGFVQNSGGGETSSGGGGQILNSGGGMAGGIAQDAGVAMCEEVDAGQPPPQLSSLRLFRRASFAVRNGPPSDAEIDALLLIPNEAARKQAVYTSVDVWMNQPAFSQTAFEFARDWMRIPVPDRNNEGGAWGVPALRQIVMCPASSFNAGAFAYGDGHWSGGIGDEATACVASNVTSINIEPWWAPGTMVRLIGRAANTQAMVTLGNRSYDCAVPSVDALATNQPCGCGANALMCRPPNAGDTFANFVNQNFMGWESTNSRSGFRRLVWEEPYRLFSHLSVNNVPIDQLLTGDKSVAPIELQAIYVRHGIINGFRQNWTNAFWKPSSFQNDAVVQGANSTDRDAWREYKPSDRLPGFLSDRAYTFDPRTMPGKPMGVPSAGVLTTFGFLQGYPRERLRGARTLETFACEIFSPPGADLAFAPYVNDPAKQGTCQHCHTRIDAASIHFKRLFFHSGGLLGWGGALAMPGIGANLPNAAAWNTGAYPYDSFPFSQWRFFYLPDTFMTPVSAAVATANPDARFIDFLPANVTLGGVASDGTIGPLGLAKLMINSGAFDRCFVRAVHKQVFGRDVDLATESAQLDLWATAFRTQDSRIHKKLIKRLIQSDSFSEGR